MPISTEALNNLISQYEESTLLRNFLTALLSELDGLEVASDEVQTLRYLQLATGTQLDVVGTLLGVNRTVVDGIISLFFGFDPNATALSFGDLNNPAIGGRYRSVGEATGSTRFLTDDEFRIFITGRINTNVSRCTGDDILFATAFFFNLIDGSTPAVQVQDGDMQFFVYVDRLLSATENALLTQLNLIPKAIGVRMGFVSYDTLNIPAWVAGTIYNFGSFVKASDTNNYVSIVDNNTGNDPVSSPADWTLSVITA